MSGSDDDGGVGAMRAELARVHADIDARRGGAQKNYARALELKRSIERAERGERASKRADTNAKIWREEAEAEIAGLEKRLARLECAARASAWYRSESESDDDDAPPQQGGWGFRVGLDGALGERRPVSAELSRVFEAAHRFGGQRRGAPSSSSSS